MSLTTLLVLADGRLPAGGHAHSGGLEAAVSARRVSDLGSLEGFLRGRLATAGLVAAAFAAAACARVVDSGRNLSDPAVLLAPPSPGWGRSVAAARGRSVADPVDRRAKLSDLAGSVAPPSPGWGAAAGNLGLLDEALDARTPSPALRRASRAQGRALLRAGRAMWPIPDAGLGREPHHPVALGVVAAAAGLTPRDAAVAAAYGSLTGPATAGVRLLGLDPYGVHALLAALAVDCDRIADEAAARASDPVDDLPAASAPLLDLGAENHATWEVRLFAS
jgi:urease accessory protein